MALEIRPLEHVGIEVVGFDAAAPIDAATKDELRALWHEHAILLFRGQAIGPAEQIEFSRIFGPLEVHPLEPTRSDDYPELFVLSSGGENDRAPFGFYHGEPIVGRLDWHMDLHYTAKPNHGAVLRAVEIPAEDGLTGFGDLARAYDALDDATKARLADIEVAYRFQVQRKAMRFVDNAGYEPSPQSPKTPAEIGFPDFPDAAYPAVVEHPITGRKVLEIVEQFLDRVVDPAAAGMTSDEADELLRDLVAHTRKPEFHYFHQWQPGDMILWDNWRAMHCTTGTKPGVRRVINRTTIEGDVQLGRALGEQAA